MITGVIFMQLIETSSHTIGCPHCQAPIITYNSHSKDEPKEPTYHFESPPFTDGDTIPFKLQEYDPNLSWGTIDNELLFGACHQCKKKMYMIDVTLISKPIGDDDHLNIWEDDYIHHGTTCIYKTDTSYPHLIVRHEQCEIQKYDSTESVTLDVEIHSIGPFPLNETISGTYGVSNHHGKVVWQKGASLLSDILENRKDMLPKLSEL